VVNLICEHCLVSAFVDQQKVVKISLVEAVARDFDLGDGNSLLGMAPAPASAAPGSKSALIEAMKTLTDLAERLRDSAPDPSKNKKL
jgi:hypothetical protein